MKDKQLLLVSFFILLVVAVGLLIGILQKPVCPVVAMDLPATTSAPTLTPAPIESPDQPGPAALSTTEVKIKTYWYRLDEYGHAIWREYGEISPGELIKRSACLADGYAQVEYRDPTRSTRWLVRFVKCEAE